MFLIWSILSGCNNKMVTYRSLAVCDFLYCSSSSWASMWKQDVKLKNRLSEFVTVFVLVLNIWFPNSAAFNCMYVIKHRRKTVAGIWNRIAETMFAKFSSCPWQNIVCSISWPQPVMSVATCTTFDDRKKSEYLLRPSLIYYQSNFDSPVLKFRHVTNGDLLD